MSDLHRATFLEEAYEHLAVLEASLLKLEEYPGDAEGVGRVFRGRADQQGYPAECLYLGGDGFLFR